MPHPLIFTREQAIRRQVHHQFVPGTGYVNHGAPPPLGFQHHGRESCDPPAGTGDDTWHWLRPPAPDGMEAKPIAMQWIAVERAWKSPRPHQSNRMAWAPAHLSRAGWKYIGPKIEMV